MLHRGHAGSGNILSTPPALLRANLCAATQGCPQPDTICGCFAGLLTERETMVAEDLLKAICGSAKVLAKPDYCAAYMASPEGTHLCVVAGTGSVLCSRTADGKWVKSGARGYLLGNPGSAFRYGQDALTHYLDDPSEASEPMQKALMETFGSTDEPQIVAKLYRAPSPAALMAKLCPVVAKDAKAGMAYALESLDRQGAALAAQAAAHLQKEFPAVAEPVVSLAGGVWDASSLYRDSFGKALQDLMPDRNISLVRLSTPPVYGAAMLAKELLA